MFTHPCPTVTECGIGPEQEGVKRKFGRMMTEDGG